MVQCKYSKGREVNTMKKNILGIICNVLAIALIGWFLFSWGNIICNNTHPNPHYSKYNLFMIMMGDDAKKYTEPVLDTEDEFSKTAEVYGNRVVWATIADMNEDTHEITFEDINGELWSIEVDSFAEFSADRFYELHFDDKGTADIADDEIVKIFLEIS